jgi:hypothetical protein
MSARTEELRREIASWFHTRSSSPPTTSAVASVINAFTGISSRQESSAPVGESRTESGSTK